MLHFVSGQSQDENQLASTTQQNVAPRRAEGWIPWEPVSDFGQSGPNSRHYMLDRLTGEIRFGDGRRGMVPPRGGDNIRASRYRTGGGIVEVTITGVVNGAGMVVNTASECGLTPQYKQLQALHEKYSKQGLAILGLPCNQFGSQEPGAAIESRDGTASALVG